MGHYDDDYEYEENKRRKSTKVKREKTLEHLQAALANSESAQESDLFKQKVREAIYWLENDLG